jgi:hypothetical protein
MCDYHRVAVISDDNFDPHGTPPPRVGTSDDYLREREEKKMPPPKTRRSLHGLSVAFSIDIYARVSELTRWLANSQSQCPAPTHISGSIRGASQYVATGASLMNSHWRRRYVVAVRTAGGA